VVTREVKGRLSKGSTTPLKGPSVPQIFGTSDMRANSTNCTRKSNQILHDNQTRREDNFDGVDHASFPGRNFFVTGMLTRDLSAVANLLVSHWFDSPVRYHHQKVSDVYVSDMLTPAADVTSRAMRSSTNFDYFVRRTTLRLGDRAFSVAAPRPWNRLPSELKTTTCSIKTVNRRLKTFLFNPVFSVNTS